MVREKSTRGLKMFISLLVHKHHLLSTSMGEPVVDLVSARRQNSLASSGGSVWADWYPLTPALSLVGRGAVEYRAPQVMLHMACSLLRRIKCQLWNHLKDQRSVFLIRPQFSGSSLVFTAHPSMFYVASLKSWTKMITYYLDMGMSGFSHLKEAVNF